MVTFTACLNRTKRNTQLTLALLSVLLVSAVALGQVLYGSIVGNVTDPNGAAVSGAKVELTNVATGAVSSTTTEDSGAYKINDLQVGTYKVTISGASFKKTIKEDVRIDANKTYRYDAQLEVGGVAETVVVTAGQEATLQTDRG
ncbi:MAG TPA: carboxypeptidase-like regulatory domain-containing protein, partial [Pyrinomonadaceae bacterium]